MNVGADWKLSPSIEYWYGPVPLLAVAVIVVVASPHFSAGAIALTARSLGTAAMVMELVAVQLLISLAVMVYVPGPLVNVGKAWKLSPSIEYWNGEVPFNTVAVIVVVSSPHFSAGADVLTVMSAGTCFTVIDASPIQPLTSDAAIL